MIVSYSLSSVLAVWLLVSAAPTLSAQGPPKEGSSTAHEIVLSLGARILDDIRTKNAASVSKLADPQGVYVGYDTLPISATQFRNELAEKRGVYCIIFGGCPERNGKNPRTDSSLRGLLIAQPVTMTVQDVQTSPLEAALVVKRSGAHGEILFTLFFRRLEDHWVLQHIEYY